MLAQFSDIIQLLRFSLSAGPRITLFQRDLRVKAHEISSTGRLVTAHRKYRAS
jgi:hypothetical protein